MNDKINKAKILFEQNNYILRTSTFKNNGFYSRDIVSLEKKKYISKIKRGYYIWCEAENSLSEYEIVCRVIPNSVICLLSAAAYYDLTTVNPMEISVAVKPNNINITNLEYPVVNIIPYYNHYEIGIIEIDDGDERFRIYDRERTVCDFFRNRNSIGQDVWLEIIKNYMKFKHKNIQKLMEYADLLTDKKAMVVYLETLI